MIERDIISCRPTGVIQSRASVHGLEEKITIVFSERLSLSTGCTCEEYRSCHNWRASRGTENEMNEKVVVALRMIDLID